MLHSRLAPLAALVVTVLSGHVTDRTTGQPLAGVRVELSGPGAKAATTNAAGEYRISGVRPGRYTVTLSSNDVMPQRFTVTIAKTEKSHASDFVACSTTLDYNCGSTF